jgi:hypothetical protein
MFWINKNNPSPEKIEKIKLYKDILNFLILGLLLKNITKPIMNKIKLTAKRTTPASNPIDPVDLIDPANTANTANTEAKPE